MSEPSAQPPLAPTRKPSLADWAKAVWLAVTRPASSVRPLLICSHQYANGASAWGPCIWNGSYWQSTCARCGLKARCR